MLLTTSEKAKEVRSHILVTSGIWSDAFRRQPLQSIQCISKCFTNGRLRIDFFNQGVAWLEMTQLWGVLING